MTRLLLWLSGADRALLARCPSEQAKHVGLGGTVATTTVLAGFAGAFATHDWLHVSVPVAVGAGLMWAAAIMNLDRWLLLTIRRQATPARTLLLALPRLVLAVVIGIVISEPLLLAVFRSEVTAQAVQDRQAQLADGRRRLDRQFAQLRTLAAERDSLREQLRASGESAALTSSPDYQALRQQLEQDQSKLSRAQKAAVCELDGTCGTGRRGVGPSYVAKRQLVDQAERSVAQSRSQLAQLRGSLVADARAGAREDRTFAERQLQQVEGDLRRLRGQHQAGVDDLLEANRAPIGLLDRVEALSTLSRENPSMRTWQHLLAVFILLVDVVPVLFKTLTLVGRRPLYEQVQDDVEEREVRRVAFDEDQRDVARRIAANAIVEDAQMHAAFLRDAREAFQRDEREEVIRRIVAVEREATERFIEGLREALAAEVPERVHRQLAGWRASSPRTRAPAPAARSRMAGGARSSETRTATRNRRNP